MSAATLRAEPFMVMVLVLCVLQLGIMARASWKPLDIPIATKEDGVSFLNDTDRATSDRRCRLATIIGDLRLYSGATLVCELLVILIAIGAIADQDSSDVSEVDDDEVATASFGSGLTPLRNFVLRQIALSLVLMRFYTVWLAHSLHKLRSELTFLVLPESPKAKKKALERQRLALSALSPAWGEPLPSPASVPAEVKQPSRCPRRSTVRAALCASLAIALVVAAAAVGLWRARKHSRFEEATSCHTATQGVDFCVPVHYLGLFHSVKSQEECCRECDVTVDCHAWSFQAEKGGGGRCWKMRFEEAPCSEQPSHPDCRCYTESGRVVGYRPDGRRSFYD